MSRALGHAMLSNRIRRPKRLLHEGILSSDKYRMITTYLRVTVGIADPSPGGASVALGFLGFRKSLCTRDLNLTLDQPDRLYKYFQSSIDPSMNGKKVSEVPRILERG